MKYLFLLFSLFFLTSINVALAAKITIDVTNNEFKGPNGTSDISINQGDTVTWDFLEGRHSTTSGVACSPNGAWDSGIMDSGTTYVRVFDSAGTFPYYCQVHCGNGMVGQLRVLKSAGIKDIASKNIVNSFTAYPNPFRSGSTIEYQLEKPARVNIQLIDANGRVVEELMPMSATGINKTQLNAEKLSQGIYVARLIIDGIITENKILIKQK